MAEGSWVNQFKGQHVTIITTLGTDERTDTGNIVELGEGWVQLQKDNGDMILVPQTAIRIIKLLNMTHLTPVDEVDPNPPLDTHIYEPNAQTLP